MLINSSKTPQNVLWYIQEYELYINFKERFVLWNYKQLQNFIQTCKTYMCEITFTGKVAVTAKQNYTNCYLRA